MLVFCFNSDASCALHTGCQASSVTQIRCDQPMPPAPPRSDLMNQCCPLTSIPSEFPLLAMIEDHLVEDVKLSLEDI